MNFSFFLPSLAQPPIKKYAKKVVGIQGIFA